MNDEHSQEQPLPSVIGKYASEISEHATINQHACYSAHATDLRMLDVRLADGSHVGLPYHYLTKISLPVPEIMTLDFASCRVAVEGLRLDLVYQALLSNRVGYIAASARSPAISAVGEAALTVEPSIHSILLTSGDE